MGILDEIKLFEHLSALLTGFTSLPGNQVAGYLQRLKEEEGYVDNLGNLLLIAKDTTIVEEFLKELTVEQTNYCKGIVFLWYTSELIHHQYLHGELLGNERKGGSEEQYYSSLLWKVIRAHPPGLSGGYFGHWKYEPEN